MTQIKIGDTIKSLDFPGNDNHWVIGKVLGIVEGYINIEATLRYNDGQSRVYKEGETARFISTPDIGLHFLDEKFPGRLTVI